MAILLSTSGTYNTSNAYSNVKQNSTPANVNSSVSLFTASSAPVETAGSVA